MAIDSFLLNFQLEQFCQRWQIAELAVFGSALRSDFTENSDLDIMVTFTPDAEWGLLDHVQMKMELEELVNKPVDLVTRSAIERSKNPIRREEILSTAKTIFVQDEPA